MSRDEVAAARPRTSAPVSTASLRSSKTKPPQDAAVGTVTRPSGRSVGSSTTLAGPPASQDSSAILLPGPLREHEDAPLVVDHVLEVGQDRFDVTGVALGDAGRHREDVLFRTGQFLVGGEPADLPPGQTDEASALLHLGHRAEAGGGQ